MVYSKINKQILDKARGYKFQSYSFKFRAEIDNTILKALAIKDKEIIENMPYVLCYGLKNNLGEKEIRQFIKIFRVLNSDLYKQKGGLNSSQP